MKTLFIILALLLIPTISIGETIVIRDGDHLYITSSGRLESDCNPSAKLHVSQPKWKVTWEVVTTYMISCPQPEPTSDEFGRVREINSMTLQACWDTRVTQHERFFSSLEYAEAFVKRGKEQESSMLWQEPDLQNFKIWETK